MLVKYLNIVNWCSWLKNFSSTPYLCRPTRLLLSLLFLTPVSSILTTTLNFTPLYFFILFHQWSPWVWFLPHPDNESQDFLVVFFFHSQDSILCSWSSPSSSLQWPITLLTEIVIQKFPCLQKSSSHFLEFSLIFYFFYREGEKEDYQPIGLLFLRHLPFFSLHAFSSCRSLLFFFSNSRRLNIILSFFFWPLI